MKITKAAIKRAYESERDLQPCKFSEWENDSEAALIYDVRNIAYDMLKMGWSKTSIIKRAYDILNK